MAEAFDRAAVDEVVSFVMSVTEAQAVQTMMQYRLDNASMSAGTRAAQQALLDVLDAVLP